MFNNCIEKISMYDYLTIYFTYLNPLLLSRLSIFENNEKCNEVMHNIKIRTIKADIIIIKSIRVTICTQVW